MQSSHTRPTSVLHLTDLHLDRANQDQVYDLLHRLRHTRYDCVIITGDITDSSHISQHIRALATACLPRPLYFVCGNHDYYGSSFKEVETEIAKLCKSIKNLHQLDGTRVLSLGKGIGLIGDRGWPDARAGDALATPIENPDRWQIEDFQGLDHQQLLHRMQSMGRESAARIRSIYPLALTRFRHLIVATHVPPFDNSVFHKNSPADDQHLPHFCNLSVGAMLISVLRAFPHRRVSVLSGHSHGSCVRQITRNLTVRVGASRNGHSIPMELLRFVA